MAATNKQVTILLIDDSKINHLVLGRILKKEFSANVLNALNSEDAIKLYKEHYQEISIIISDGNLGENSIKGPELCEQLIKLQLEYEKDVPIIAWTNDVSLQGGDEDFLLLANEKRASFFAEDIIPATFKQLSDKYQREHVFLAKPCSMEDVDSVIGPIVARVSTLSLNSNL